MKAKKSHWPGSIAKGIANFATLDKYDVKSDGTGSWRLCTYCKKSLGHSVGDFYVKSKGSFHCDCFEKQISELSKSFKEVQRERLVEQL